MTLTGGKRRRSVLASLAIVAGMLILAALPNAAAASSGIVYLAPSGGDDTDAIQAAFDACAVRGSKCTVELGAGTFHTGMVLVHDFDGKVRGMGQGRTVIEALPDLPRNEDSPLWLHPPSLDNPWPDLFIFIDGAFSISDMTFSEPWNVPTKGWFAFGAEYDALHAAILITGSHAEVAINRVTVLGAEGDFFGSNMVNGIFYEGILLREEPANEFDWIPMGGTFSATNSAFFTIDNPLAFSTLLGARVSARGNAFRTTEYPFAFLDVYDSVLEFSDNRASDVFGVAGVAGFQSLINAGSIPSSLLVTDNELSVTNGASGVLLLDFGEQKTLDATIARNEIRMDETSFAGVASFSVHSTEVYRNDFRGGGLGVYLSDGSGIVAENEIRDAGIGVLLETAVGAVVSGNEIKDSAVWGIAVTAGSSDCLVAQNEIHGSGEFDLYWDGSGTDNVWMNNDFQTSSPANL